MSSDPHLALQACISCKRLKRRCTRALPTCSLCSKVGRTCEYPTPSASSDEPSPSRVALPRGGVESNDSLWRPDNSTFAFGDPLQTFLPSPHTSQVTENQTSTDGKVSIAAFFLDSVATRGRQVGVRGRLQWGEVQTDLPPLSLQQATEIARLHFATTHSWLPIVSKKRLTRQLQTGRDVVYADQTALLYAMVLLGGRRTDESLSIYKAVEAAIQTCESYGQMSTMLLAAQTLLAFYELGQGYFPTVYYTVARCARLCQALGLHDKRKATQLLPKADSWTEVEERRRLWWSILILDRYIHLGFRFRNLFIPHIPPEEIIPADDEKWDEGEQAVNPLVVMSIEAATKVSPFARVCQAAHLAGKVCQHVNEHPSAEDADLHFQEAYQLSKATDALLAMLDGERQREERPDRLFASRALCYSALLLLFDVHSCVEVDEIESCGGNRGLRLDLQQLAIDGYKRISPRVRELAGEIEDHLTSQIAAQAEVSPLTLHCLYSTAGVCAWYMRETGNENHLDSLNELRSVLRKLQQRWHLASHYLDLLEGTENDYLGACYQ